MRVEKRFWQATVAGGLLTALLYFLLVYVRSSPRSSFWPALWGLLASWRGVEVLITFCLFSALALAMARKLQATRNWGPWPSGAVAGAAAGLVYGLWLLAATGAADWTAAISGMIWFMAPFTVSGSIIAATYARSS